MKIKDFGIDRDKIREMLSEKADIAEIITVEETGSTNDELKKIALTGEKRSILFVAASQTKGRGRKGRSFFSPAGTGIYMSLLLHPELTAHECTLITPLCAVALAEAIEEATGIRAGIKWVNDIFVSDRKVAGILTEGAFSGGKADYIVVGAGVNLAAPEGGFPGDIAETAGYLTEADTQLKNQIIAETVNRLTDYLGTVRDRVFVEKYRERLFFLGERVSVISASGTYDAVAADIDNDCRLIVRTDAGEEKILDSGEISIRMNNGV